MNRIFISIGLVSFIYSCLCYHNFIKNKNNNDNKKNTDDISKDDEIIKEEVNKIVDKVIKDRKVHFDENWIEIKP